MKITVEVGTTGGSVGTYEHDAAPSVGDKLTINNNHYVVDVVRHEIGANGVVVTVEKDLPGAASPSSPPIMTG